LGTKERVSSALAAFANGELMHATDHCPLLPPAHITPFVTSAPLALSEAKRVSGKTLITAVALAHEVASRVGLSLDPMRVTTGGPIAQAWGLGFDQFGATAGAAKILDLAETPALNALGLAGYIAPVPSHNKFLSTPRGGGMAKYGSAGWTAQGGVTAALLADLGYQGDRTILDGEFGFWAMTGSKRFDSQAIVAGLNENWKILRVMYKRWPCAGNLQAPLGALTKLVAEHDLKPGEIERILIKNEGQGLLPRFQYPNIDHHVDTQTNLAYNIALVAHRVAVSSDWQSERYINDFSIRTLMEKVVIEGYEKANEMRHQELVVEGRSYIERRPCFVEVSARGAKFTEEVEYAYWLSMDNPQYRATDEDLIRKFRANAGLTLSTHQVDRAVEKIMGIEELTEVEALFEELKA
jgi:2-methylcitrate dehydratase PrpD